MDETMEPKIIVHTDGHENTIRIGDDLIILDDLSDMTFNTDSLLSFINYILTQVNSMSAIITYNVSKIVCTEKIIDRNTLPHAVCTLSESVSSKKLIDICGSKMDIGTIERFLRTMVRYRNNSASQLYDYVRNFEMHKITSVKRENDDRGNYNYQVKRESANIDPLVQIPKKVGFNIPLFASQSVDVNCDIEFDVVFSWKEGDNGVQLSFSLENPEIVNEIETAMYTTIESALTALPIEKYRGRLELVKQDNNWQYVRNGLTSR